MNNNDRGKFSEAIDSIRELYDKPKLSTQAKMMYFAALERFTINDVMTALSRHAQNADNGQYFPKPADIIRQLQGDSETQAGIAWTKVDKAIRTIGPNASVVFDDGIIHRVIVDMGGWITVCMTKGDDYPFRRNEFVKRYRGFVSNPPTLIPRKLIGVEEDQNANDDYYEKRIELPAPTVVGDVQKARLVYKRGSGERGIGITSLTNLLEDMKGET